MFRAALVIVLASTLATAACGGPGPRDVAGHARTPRDAAATPASTMPPPAPAPPRTRAHPRATGRKPAVLARVTSRAVAVDAARIYYGDSSDDALLAAPKSGGEPERLARRAPVAGALDVSGGRVTWVASPGDAVLTMSVTGGEPTPLRERGIFVDVVASGDDAFVAEVSAGGGSLTRVTKGTSTKLASLDAAPREIALDASYVYVTTVSKVVRVSRAGGAAETLAGGAVFDRLALGEADVFTLQRTGQALWLVRVPKAGGDPVRLAERVADAPIATFGGEVYFFDTERHQLRAVSAKGGEARVVSRDQAFAQPLAVAADAAAIYVASGAGEAGLVLRIPRGI